MQKSSFKRWARKYHQRLVTALAVGWLLSGYFSAAQVVVTPTPRFYQADSSGNPLAFGCVFTYQSGTTTPLASYTDFSGVTSNANPVILSAGGTANIWLKAGNAYRIRVVSFGGLNCASGTQQYSIDGIGGGTTLNVTNVTYSATPTFTIVAQTQLFTITLTGNASAQPLTAVGIVAPAIVTFEITQDAAGGHTFSWPANSIGGAPIGLSANQVTTQMFVWNGITANAIGPAITGNGPIESTGSLIASGTGAFGGALSAASLNITGAGVFGSTLTATGLISATANPASAGFLRLANANAINWRNNANSADYGISADATDHGLLSFTNGAMLTGSAPYLRWVAATNGNPMLKNVGTALEARLADDSGDAPFSASALSFGGLGGVTISGACTTGQVLVASSSSAVACAASPATIQAASTTTNTGTNIGASATTWVTKAVTMPSAGCPCRAFVSFGVHFTTPGSGTATFWVEDGTNTFATTSTLTASAGGNAQGASASAFSIGTYTNSAVITFIGRGYTDAGTIQTANWPFGSSQSPWLNVVIFTSN